MKLYLSSYRVPVLDELVHLLGREPADTKMALIPNAKDYYAGRARAFKIREVDNYFQTLGFKSTVVDLLDYQSGNDLETVLNDFDFIWVMGGNTFILRQEMQRSGFDKVIRSLLKKGKVYGGESAGALIAGNVLNGVEFADEPEFAEKVLWDGLKLTDHFVLPHVGSTEFGDAIEQAKAAHVDDKTMIELTDAQAFVVNGSEIKVVTGSA